MGSTSPRYELSASSRSRIIVSRSAMRLLTTDAIWPTTIQAAGSSPKNARERRTAGPDATTTKTTANATHTRVRRLITAPFPLRPFRYTRGTSRSCVR